MAKKEERVSGRDRGSSGKRRKRVRRLKSKMYTTDDGAMGENVYIQVLSVLVSKIQTAQIVALCVRRVYILCS